MILFGVTLPEREKSEPLTAKAERETILLAQTGDERAIQTLIERNSRLVLKIALKYRGLGLDMSDLHQEGLWGIWEALKLFDASQGMRFMTYAAWRVRQRMRDAVHEMGSLIRVPRKFQENVKSGATEKWERRHAFYLAALRPARLDQQEGGLQLPDQETRVDGRLEALALKASLDRCLDSLKPVERKVIKARYGWDTGEPVMHREIAEEVGVSTQRIQQLQVQGEKRMAVLMGVGA